MDIQRPWIYNSHGNKQIAIVFNKLNRKPLEKNSTNITFVINDTYTQSVQLLCCKVHRSAGNMQCGPPECS